MNNCSMKEVNGSNHVRRMSAEEYYESVYGTPIEDSFPSSVQSVFEGSASKRADHLMDAKLLSGLYKLAM